MTAPAARRQHMRRLAQERAMTRRSPSRKSFAELLEISDTLSTGRRLDLVIGRSRNGHLHPRRQLAPERGFARAHHADQRHGFLKCHEASHTRSGGERSALLMNHES